MSFDWDPNPENPLNHPRYPPRPSLMRESRGLKGAGAILLLLLIGSLFLGYVGLYRGTETRVTATVKKLDIKTYSDGDGGTKSKYLVYTPNETFEITDKIAYGRFDSSDLYGTLEEGQTYTFTVAGWRIHLVSSYRNIIKAEQNGKDVLENQ